MEGSTAVASLVKLDRVSFGLFEADLNTGELWKAGFRIRLPGQPFKVLAALLARPGEVVTREELQTQVWGSNTNVDFERALAGAINKVREALGDSPENPRFVETLTKRGYRFIAPVTVLNSAATAQSELNRSKPILSEALTIPPVVPSRIAQPPANIGIAGERAVVTADRPPKDALSRREKVFAALAILFLLSTLAALVLSRKRVDRAPLRIDQLTNNTPISVGPPNMETLPTLAADGDRVFTSVDFNGVPRLSVIFTSTGEIQPLPMPNELASNSLADISRDGSKLLLRSRLSSESEQPLWVVPSAGGSALRVGGILAHDAAWMPDGNSVIYANGNDLLLIRLDSGVTKLYAHLPGRAFWLRWSLDGKILRFTLMDPITHGSSIWELAADSRKTKPLSETMIDGFSVGCGTWTADGNAFIFQASDNRTSNLWELLGSGRGSTLIQLTNGPLRYISPAAARSGSRLFFLGLSEPSGMQELVVSEHAFRPAPAFLADSNRVDYSRDGSWVAWTDNNGRLWRARSKDGSEKLQLTPSSLEVFSAHWSPDATHIALMARTRGSVWQIYTVAADGGTPERLLEELRNEADPSWSPDGRSIVFGREPDLMGKEPGPRTIQILDLASHRVMTLPGSDGLFSPRWSPDGRWIAALTLDQKDVELFDITQRRWKHLATTSAADPVWSPDSMSIFVHAYLADEEPILNISVPNGAVQVVANLSDFHNGEMANYFFGGITPTNAPLVQPRIGTGNLYTTTLDLH